MVLVFALTATVHAEIPASAVSADALRAVVPADTGVETLPGGYILLVPEPFAPPVSDVDPLYKNKTSRVFYLYEKAESGDKVTRRAIVHFEPDDRTAALHAARLVARLLHLHHEHFGRETVFQRGATVAHLWLIPTTPATATEGGETRDANIFLFAPSKINAPIEQTRTIAHEWGHLTLPAARGYTQPEADAAGYLGERLYLNYLFWDALNHPARPDTGDGATLADLRMYHHRQIAPLRERYEAGGAGDKRLDADTTEAMDYYIGAVLDTDETIGSRLVGDALYGVEDTSAREFLRSLKRATAKAFPSGIFVERRAWLYFEPGAYRLDVVSGGGGIYVRGAGRVVIATKSGAKDGLPAPKPGEKRDGKFRVVQSGWYAVSAFGSLTEYRLYKTISSRAVK